MQPQTAHSDEAINSDTSVVSAVYALTVIFLHSLKHLYTQSLCHNALLSTHVQYPAIRVCLNFAAIFKLCFSITVCLNYGYQNVEGTL